MKAVSNLETELRTMPWRHGAIRVDAPRGMDALVHSARRTGVPHVNAFPAINAAPAPRRMELSVPHSGGWRLAPIVEEWMVRGGRCGMVGNKFPGKTRETC